MKKCYMYHLIIHEVNLEDSKIQPVLDMHSDTEKLYHTKDEAILAVLDILSKWGAPGLLEENQRLKRVIEALDNKLADALTVRV